MGFTKSVFIFVLLPICLIGYFAFVLLEKSFDRVRKYKLKEVFLLLFSLFFYSFFDISNLIWIVSVVAITFVFGRLICISKSCKRLLLTLAIILSVGTLFVFKYYCSFMQGVAKLFDFTYSFETLVAPIGISFIVFSVISYLVDVYRGNAEKGSFLSVALYILYFPKVVSGPIVFWKDFLKQSKLVKVSSDLFVKGINRICIGFAKKVLIADVFGSFVNEIMQNLSIGIDTPSAWVLTLFFYFQLYYDFSGYSDISLGISNILGYQFDNNFNFPYMSTSITEFWNRWHISLGKWFKEYLYISLGGNRCSLTRNAVNIMIVFIATGVWHGAGILYFLWGVIHGICRVVERLVCNTALYQKTPKFFKWLFTTAIVMLGWLVFCFTSPTELWAFLKTLFGVTVAENAGLTVLYFCNLKAILTTVIAILGCYLFGTKKISAFGQGLLQNKVTFVISELFLLAMFVLSLIFMINSTYSPFLYFQY